MGVPEIPVFTAGGTDALPPPVADHEAGALVLKNLLPPETVTALHTAYAAHYKEVTDRTTGPHIKEVGDKRLMRHCQSKTA